MNVFKILLVVSYVAEKGINALRNYNNIIKKEWTFWYWLNFKKVVNDYSKAYPDLLTDMLLQKLLFMLFFIQMAVLKFLFNFQ